VSEEVLGPKLSGETDNLCFWIFPPFFKDTEYSKMGILRDPYSK
jgi:hypothetical protein